MSRERLLTPATFTIVCVALVALTVLTVGVSFIRLPGFWHTFLGLAIALVKASLVVLFFMHVLASTRLTWVVIIVACFWLVILFGLTLTDYFTREVVPHMTGH
jgi:cytochrome c oxidase subunit 4